MANVVDAGGAAAAAAAHATMDVGCGLTSRRTLANRMPRPIHNHHGMLLMADGSGCTYGVAGYWGRAPGGGAM